MGNQFPAISSNAVKVNDNSRILFIGNLSIGSNALSLLNGFRKTLEKTEFIDSTFFDSPSRYSLRRVLLKFLPTIYARLSALFLGIRIQNSINHTQPDMLVVFKGNYVSKRILAFFPGIKVHYHPDDSSNPVNRTHIFDQAEAFYDVHFTSKKHNLTEIATRTKRPVHFIWYAYDENWHFFSDDIDFSHPEFKAGFIGHMRPDRLELMERLGVHFGKNLAVSGLKWERSSKLSENATVLKPVYGENFSHFTFRAPVQLGLLNSDNRDQHTARTFEIPATGALLIAEDTKEHREIFKSEKYALFFRDFEELVRKIEWASANPLEASRIARNGHELVVRNQNSWTDRAGQIIKVINSRHQ